MGFTCIWEGEMVAIIYILEPLRGYETELAYHPPGFADLPMADVLPASKSPPDLSHTCGQLCRSLQLGYIMSSLMAYF